jgi:CopG-like RHH_1 or ribbon-helix-helix domain, RHH_5
MTQRIQVSLPDEVHSQLQQLAADCEMSTSQCITQLIRRHNADIRNLFAINCNPLQPAATNCNQLQPSDPLPLIEPLSVASMPEVNDLLSMIANS